MKTNVLKYLNELQGYRAAIKNLHWSSSNMSEHKVWDDIDSSVGEAQDEIAEVAQGMFGQIKKNELKPISYTLKNSKEALNAIIDSTKAFHKTLTDESTVQLKSVVENVLADLEKYKYLLNLSLKEDIQQRMTKSIRKNKTELHLNETELRALIREAVENVMQEANPRQRGSGEILIEKMVNELKDFMDSNHVIWTSPHPSSTEQQVKQYIINARELLARAQLGLRSLRM